MAKVMGTEIKKESKEKITLDKQQQAIIDSKDKNICIIAGAGSGKTRVLIEKVASLLKRGADPSEIVCITFTTMAAQEMKKRFENFDTRGMFVGTIHSFAYNLLSNIGIKPSLLTPDKENEIAEGLVKKYAKYLTLDKYHEWARNCQLVQIGYMKKKEADAILDPLEEMELIRLLDIKDPRFIFNEKHQYTYEQLVEKILKFQQDPNISQEYPETVTSVASRNNIMTFDAMLNKAAKAFKQVDRYVKYLFVDEFQDIGVFEYQFLMGLNAANMFVVGDDYQSIYAFKGADFEYFKALKDNPEFKTFYLESNYRCVPQIVNYSNKIIEQIDDVIPKKCKSKSPKITGKVIRREGNLQTVMNYITSINSLDWGKWFILTRSNNDMIDISRSCYANNIAYDTFKKGNLNLQKMEELMSKNSIKILTVHAAKGLEADNVILYGDFPDEPDEAYWEMHGTEGRRIMYVGATRARNNLVVIYNRPKR